MPSVGRRISERRQMAVSRSSVKDVMTSDYHRPGRERSQRRMRPNVATLAAARMRR